MASSDAVSSASGDFVNGLMRAREEAPVRVSIRNLYKIFGEDPQAALAHVRDGCGKKELLEEHNHVLGLKDINVDIRQGRITVIMGLSGSGKSTLIRHLNRLIDPTAGEIVLDGDDIVRYSVDQLRELRQSQMSMVFQKFALLPHRTVLQNAALPLRIRGEDEKRAMEEARKWLARVDLGGFEDHYPHQLSGGMQQRVGLARALTSNCDVMLMDEAFSALDPLIRNDMQDLLAELQKDLHKTIVFITHDLDESLKLADHLVILKDGYLVQQGEPQEVLLHPNDPYIEDFVRNVNLARVLRTRSIMAPLDEAPAEIAGEVDQDDTLESVIARTEGEMSKCCLVMHDGKPVGVLHMRDLVKALVPRVANGESGGSHVAR